MVCPEGTIGGVYGTAGAVICNAGCRIVTVILPTLHRRAQIVPGFRYALAYSFVMIRYCGERLCSVLNGLCYDQVLW